MSKSELRGRFIAFVLAGAAVAFGVSVVASWIGLPAIAVAVVVVFVLGVLGRRVFSYIPSEEETD
jgi:hypothetical protein